MNDLRCQVRVLGEWLNVYWSRSDCQFVATSPAAGGERMGIVIFDPSRAIHDGSRGASRSLTIGKLIGDGEDLDAEGLPIQLWAQPYAPV